MSQKVLQEIKSLLDSRGEFVVTAESCTGGRVAAALTEASGASTYFIGSVVSYSNEVKAEVLHVSKKTLAEMGAVSEETVHQMAEGVLNVLGGDWALVTSGVAGPLGGSARTPVGTVWMAIAKKRQTPTAWVEHFSGDRHKIMQQAVQSLLERFKLELQDRND